MKIAIHQPEHFPYLGFFQKMNLADIFVILDDVQYTKNNFQNRNRFLNKNNTEEWFTVELEPGANKKLIKDIKVSSNSKWKKVVLNKIQTNFKKDLSSIYLSANLLDINIASINYCRDALKINTPIIMSSELEISGNASARLAKICSLLNASEYISGEGGKNYLEENLFDCKVSYFKPDIPNYYTTLQHI